MLLREVRAQVKTRVPWGSGVSVRDARLQVKCAFHESQESQLERHAYRLETRARSDLGTEAHLQVKQYTV